MFAYILNAYRHEKHFKIAILLIAIISMGHWMPVKQVCDLNSLSLQNVEALANGETPNYTFVLVRVLWIAQFNMIK